MRCLHERKGVWAPLFLLFGEVMAKVILSTKARQAIRADMRQRSHIEACGLLLGEISEAGDWMVEEALPLANICNSPTRFEFDSNELLSYDLRYGERIVGAYHSHLSGLPQPSGIDKGNMENLQDSPWIWLIASFHGDAQRGTAGTKEDTLALAAYRHNPQQGLQTITILITP